MSVLALILFEFRQVERSPEAKYWVRSHHQRAKRSYKPVRKRRVEFEQFTINIQRPRRRRVNTCPSYGNSRKSCPRGAARRYVGLAWYLANMVLPHAICKYEIQRYLCILTKRLKDCRFLYPTHHPEFDFRTLKKGMLIKQRFRSLLSMWPHFVIPSSGMTEILQLPSSLGKFKLKTDSSHWPYTL